jgi:hypothetical protein
MAANVIGLIEIETSPAAPLRFAIDNDGLDTLLTLSPAADQADETHFLRADLDQLRYELDSAFADLLQRLLQGD